MDALNRRAIPREAFTATGTQNVSVTVDTASVVAAITSLHADLGNILSEHDGGENVTYRDLVRMVRKCMR